MTKLGKYDPNILSLVPRGATLSDFEVENQKYEVKVFSKPKNKKMHLVKEKASSIVALAIAGALTIGAKSAIVTLLNSPSSSEIEQYNGNNYITYIVPSEITLEEEVKIKVLPDGNAIIILENGEEKDFYNGKTAEELLNTASSKGMLYRDMSEYEKKDKAI